MMLRLGIDSMRRFSLDHERHMRARWWWSERAGAIPIDGPAPSAETWESWAS